MLHMFVVFLLLALSSPAHAVVYLCPTDGDGSDENPYRSRAISELLPGRGNVDIRDDATAPGIMLCESDVLPTNMTGVVVVGANRRSIVGGKTKTDTEAASGRVLRGATTEDVIKELVIPHLPTPKSGTYDIRLGTTQPRVKEIASFSNDVYYKGVAAAVKEWGTAFARSTLENFSVPVAWATTLATETFNCSDAGTLDCVHDWITKVGNNISIVSNQASHSASGTGINVLNSALATTDQEFSVTVVSATVGSGTAASCSVWGRGNTTTGTGDADFYRTAGLLASTGELNSVALIKTINNASTTLATDTTDFANNDILAVRMITTAISSWKNSVEILSVTDGDITTGNYGGLRVNNSDATGNCTMDNFNGQDISSRQKGGVIWFR